METDSFIKDSLEPERAALYLAEAPEEALAAVSLGKLPYYFRSWAYQREAQNRQGYQPDLTKIIEHLAGLWRIRSSRSQWAASEDFNPTVSYTELLSNIGRYCRVGASVGAAAWRASALPWVSDEAIAYPDITPETRDSLTSLSNDQLQNLITLLNEQHRETLWRLRFLVEEGSAVSYPPPQNRLRQAAGSAAVLTYCLLSHREWQIGNELQQHCEWVSYEESRLALRGLLRSTPQQLRYYRQLKNRLTGASFFK